jgi:ribosomal protein S18 acetylase RimI-like enzyme
VRRGGLQPAWECRLGADAPFSFDACRLPRVAFLDAMNVSVRPLTVADLRFASQVRALAGWNQTEADWRGYLEFEPEGCFIAEAGGKPAGTATAIRYGEKFGWIGMVLVHPEARRHGIGTTLLRATIDYLQQRGPRCVKLDATPMGKKVYVPLGFRDEYDVTRYEGTAPMDAKAPDGSVRWLADGGLADVVAFDTSIFGAERGGVLQSLSRRNPEFCFVAHDTTGVAGYLIAREGANALQLGPWLARDATTAERLLRAFFQRVPGRRIFVDVPQPNTAGVALIALNGFTVQRGFTRMYLGENRDPGRPEQVFGTSGAEKG